ncbi:biotin--[acetyl-CoA-carboxylase] ligase [uncultured Clostridium sp.]|uniref:biotin--[acetyl-CoA-carboxylase] ligase n=1 Tax=uncultured Clostridium sp. TaxID=59620 RepID=UPI00266EE498|nr:biotin--[acetyl-CoA-carboxylase] ligase [uncultured Clostridium sp.]
MLKSKAVKTIEENKRRTFLATEITKPLNLSTISISKAIKPSRNDSYTLTSTTTTRYFLSKNSDFISKEGITLYLNDEFKYIDIYTYKKVTSTNDIAKKLALNGAKHGTIVISEEQTNGKGRLGRSFYSPANTGIYMSIILKLSLTTMDSVLITTSSAVAICDAIEKLTGINCQIKWINDIYLNGKKIAGILAETFTNFESKTIDYLILGIGLNFTQPKNDFPEELRKIASSLFEHNNSTINRNLLCAEIANNILNMISKIENYDFISEYKKRSIVLNQDIIYTSKGISLIGKAIDIANDGSLIVKNSDGSTKILNSGDITIRKVNE